VLATLTPGALVDGTVEVADTQPGGGQSHSCGPVVVVVGGTMVGVVVVGAVVVGLATPSRSMLKRPLKLSTVVDELR
jgi:hypothetical protein